MNALYMGNLDIDDLMEDILRAFHEEGNLTTGALVDRTGKARNTVTKRLDMLRFAGYIEYAHEGTGLHRLIGDPREGHSLSPVDEQRASGSATEPETDDSREDAQEEG